MTDLWLSFYSAGGALLYTATFADVPHVFDFTLTGVGNAGWLFQLDNAQAAQASALIGSNFATTRVGLTSTLTSGQGAPGTFFLTSLGGSGGGGQTLPEPSTLALLGLGVAGLGFASVQRRRQRAR